MNRRSLDFVRSAGFAQDDDAQGIRQAIARERSDGTTAADERLVEEWLT
jgi:hypothetical protein